MGNMADHHLAWKSSPLVRKLFERSISHRSDSRISSHVPTMAKPWQWILIDRQREAPLYRTADVILLTDLYLFIYQTLNLFARRDSSQWNYRISIYTHKIRSKEAPQWTTYKPWGSNEARLDKMWWTWASIHIKKDEPTTNKHEGSSWNQKI